IFRVNWFRRDTEGRFLWPGYGENARVLKWMVDRIHGRGQAVETPLGFIPTADSLDFTGLEIDRRRVERALAWDRDEWLGALGPPNRFSRHLRPAPPGPDPRGGGSSDPPPQDSPLAAMDFGAAIFFTDYSMGPADLARALEERGFDSVWAPEHSHIPLSRRSPFPQGGDLPKKYYDVMDPFVTLSAAAAVTTKLKVATGICLVVQRDPIQTAKHVATLDQVSGGRVLFGIGAGWNAEEMADHGTEFSMRFEMMRERVEAMKA